MGYYKRGNFIMTGNRKQRKAFKRSLNRTKRDGGIWTRTYPRKARKTNNHAKFKYYAYDSYNRWFKRQK